MPHERENQQPIPRENQQHLPRENQQPIPRETAISRVKDAEISQERETTAANNESDAENFKSNVDSKENTPQKNSNSPVHTKENAVEAYEKGEYKTAAAIYKDLLNADPDGSDAAALLAGLASVLLSLKETEESAVYAEKALTLAPDNSVALCVLATHRLLQKRIDEAAQLAEKGLSLQYPRSLATLASIRMAQKRSIEAESLLAFACTNIPTAEAFAQYGLYLFQQQRLEPAGKMAEEALKRKPFLAKIWLMLGSIRAKLQQFAASRQAYEKAMELEPDATTAGALCGLCRNLKDYPAARSWGEKALQLDPKCIAAHLNMGSVEQDLQNIDAALQWYNNALAINENLLMAHSNIGILLGQKKDWPGVLAAMERAMHYAPQHPAILANRLTALIKLNRLDEVERELTVSPNPLPPEETFRLRKSLHERRGEFDKFRKLVDEFLANVVSTPHPQFSLALQILVVRISVADQHISFPEAFNRLFALHKDNLRYQGMVASYGMIWAWMRGDRKLTRELANTTKDYLAIRPTASDAAQINFYKYINKLSLSANECPELYPQEPDLPVLNVLGESHSLSPCHTVLEWHGQRVRATSRYVFDMTMHALANKQENQQRYYFCEYLRNLPDGHLLLTIGEIDCRPEGGVWLHARRNSLNPLEVLNTTVNGYLHALDTLLAERPWASITLQGIPAPGYALTGPNGPDDVPAFLGMIREANHLLRTGAHQRGWSFLDVYSLTANPDGTCNGLYHLDLWHLKPKIYTLLRPE